MQQSQTEVITARRQVEALAATSDELRAAAAIAAADADACAEELEAVRAELNHSVEELEKADEKFDDLTQTHLQLEAEANATTR